jgi:hypothetical protein
LFLVRGERKKNSPARPHANTKQNKNFSSNGKPGAGDLYLAAMDALYAVYPGFLFVIEGCGQAGLAKNWGDGLATDPALIASRGLSDPRPFFTALLDKPYVNQVVAGPHIYGPSVARTQADMTG